MPATTNTTTARVHNLNVRADNALSAVRAKLGLIAVQAIATGYPGKLEVVNAIAREAGQVCKRASGGSAGISTGLAHAFSLTLSDFGFVAGDTVNISIVSPADLAADESIPDVFLTQAEREAKAKADSIEARAKALADVEAAKAAAPDSGFTSPATKTEDEVKAEREAKRLADRAAAGILEASLDRPWVVTPAKWESVRTIEVTFKVPTLDQVVAFYAAK